MGWEEIPQALIDTFINEEPQLHPGQQKLLGFLQRL
jgi:hypothetical protein